MQLHYFSAPEWTKRYITFDWEQRRYIAWDETQAFIIGKFSTIEEAVDNLIFYAKTIGAEHGKDNV
jgi:hypothetical protein